MIKQIIQQFIVVICLIISNQAISSTLVDITYTADNVIRAFYILDNGSSQLLPLGVGAENWKLSDSVTLDLETETTYEFIWQVQNVSGEGASPGGFLAEIRLPDQVNSPNLLSSSAWQVAFVEDKLDQIDLSALIWVPATEYGSNNDQSNLWYQYNEGPVANISGEANWIWWETNWTDPNAPWSNDSVFIRTTIKLRTIPAALPWLMLLLDSTTPCDSNHVTFCSTSDDCTAAGGYWWSDDSCRSIEEIGSICSDTCQWADDGICDDGGFGSNFDVCGFGTDCVDCGIRYCDINNLFLCLTSSDCTNAGGYWWGDGFCNDTQEPPCESINLGYCHTNVECTNAGGYWWSINSCLPEAKIITEIVEVTSAGQVWMDRNLGASRVATSSTDSLAYGYLFQWGRGADGHQSRGSSTTTKLSPTDVPGHGKFILIDNISPYDWRVEQNNALWQGANGINNPCPAGFRIPTREEMEIELNSWKTKDSAGAFASPLKLTLAEVRNSVEGEVTSGYGGVYWGSSSGPKFVICLSFHDSTGSICAAVRANGYSIRCIKD